MTPHSPSALDHRSSMRQSCRDDVPIAILVRPLMKRYQVVLWDVCRNGISFLLHEPLKPGAVLAFQRFILQPGSSWIRSGKVAHVTPHDGQWLIGCEVTPAFSADELHALL